MEVNKSEFWLKIAYVISELFKIVAILIGSFHIGAWLITQGILGVIVLVPILVSLPVVILTGYEIKN